MSKRKHVQINGYVKTIVVLELHCEPNGTSGTTVEPTPKRVAEYLLTHFPLGRLYEGKDCIRFRGVQLLSRSKKLG